MGVNEETTMDVPHIVPDKIATLAQTRFVSLYDLEYDDGSHYFEASRRPKEDLLACKSGRELRRTLPDAVSCCLVLVTNNSEPRLVLSYEYRYPTGQFVLGIPSGLVDEQDQHSSDPLVKAMRREIAEETGLRVGESDRIWVVNPFLFNSPGLTDESTALLCAVVRRPDDGGLSHAGAEGTERFDGFELLTKAQVQDVLEQGCDRHGHYYPLVAWAAMTYFVTDQWTRIG